MSIEDNEHKIIQNVVKGDTQAFDKIFSKYNRKVYAFSLKNLKSKDDAENIVQDVFVNLWKDREKLKEVENLDAWIFSICFNTIRKHFRQLTREKKHLHNFVASRIENDNSTIPEVEYNDLLDRAEQIIERLPQRQKDIFVLSKKVGLSNEEISEKLQISKKTVENHLSKAKAFIKKTLVDEGLLSLLFYWLFIK